MLSYEVLLKSFPFVLSGLKLTVILTVCSFVIGQVLALPLGLALYSRRWWLRVPAAFYTFIIRGSPLLVQIYIIYYGFSQFPAVRDSIFWPVLKEPFYCALLAIGLNSAAYMAEIIAGALRKIPPGQQEACLSLGLPNRYKFRDVLLPQMYRAIFPMIGSEMILVLKASALASAITLMEMIGMAKLFFSRAYTPFEPFIAAGILYLLIGLVISIAFRVLEKRLFIPASAGSWNPLKR
ncbi:MAG: Octopine transport system permease protein OccM [Candidatus Tokpelaia hoelldobleri]|uniref:Octopine transport system permease protein OccM n=1 Tax=Candidatus Tokpelaia hoelldobleri TaxID=1902579 RepID=A0A1U9JTH2_9HYPH|nr:MAG: Octopine transport system permease protein OccM [Candidatus Tokpelaia hoelldoblerii]